jgi:hypothetical protein
MLKAAVHILQAQQPIHIQSGQAAALQGTQIAAGTFHPHYFGFFSGERMFFYGFARCVAATVISEPEIRT